MRFSSRQAVRKAYIRMMRHPGTPQRMGRGVAIGLFVAFAVPFGFHMVFALALAFLLRGARLAAVSVTWIINPLTMAIVYPVQCCLGGYMLGRPFSYGAVMALFDDALRGPSWGALAEIGRDMLVYCCVGGGLLGLVVAWIGYHATVIAIVRYRKRKEMRKSSSENTVGQTEIGLKGS